MKTKDLIHVKMDCRDDVFFLLHENSESLLDNTDLAMSQYLGALTNHVEVLVQAIPKYLLEFRELAQFRYDRLEYIDRAIAVDNIAHLSFKV